MKKVFSFLFLSLFIICGLASQAAVSELAKGFANAYIEKDYQTIVKLTHPEIIEKGGGEDFIISDLKASLDNSAAQILKYTSCEVLEPLEYFKEGEELQTIIPVRFFLEAGEQLYGNTTHFLAVSPDEGQDWKFVHLEYYDAESLKIFISNLSPDIDFPADKPFEVLNKEEKGG